MPQPGVGLGRVAGADGGGDDGPPPLQPLVLPVDHRLDPAGVGLREGRGRRGRRRGRWFRGREADGVVGRRVAAVEQPLADDLIRPHRRDRPSQLGPAGVAVLAPAVLPLAVLSHQFTIAAVDLRARVAGEAVAVDLDIRDRRAVRAREVGRRRRLRVQQRQAGEAVDDGIPPSER